MIRSLVSRYLRHWRDETGSAAVEFVLVFPVMATMIVMTLEVGFITLRQTMLERGLDMAVREVRLGTNSAPQHDAIKDLVCENAKFVKECQSKLFLEMVTTDPRAFSPLNPVTSCTDQPVPTRPVRSFTPGQPNQLVLMRACLKYDPLFPEAILSRLLTKDADDEAAIIAVTSFVQEPL
jgi:Flp pilus assembly protein TadG